MASPKLTSKTESICWYYVLIPLTFFFRPLCIHCTLLEDLHDVRDVTLSVYKDGYLTDDSLHRIHSPSGTERKAEIKKLLSALVNKQRRECAPVTENRLESSVDL